MSQVLDVLEGYQFGGCNSFLDDFRGNAFALRRRKQSFCSATAFKKYRGGVQFSTGVSRERVERVELHSISHQAKTSDGAELHAFPYVQNLRDFPKEELSGKIVMVRFDSKLILLELHECQFLSAIALSTIEYLHNAGAKVLLVSRWDAESNSKVLTTKSVAEFLSSILGLKVVPVEIATRHMHYDVEAWEESHIVLLENLFRFKGERANCKSFSKQLSHGVDIFVNDAFSQSHKMLASTVGITRFCSTCIAGFYFEESIRQLKKITKTSDKSYVAIIGGGNLVEKAEALQFLASICDGLVFVGNIAFQIMLALGLPVPRNLVEHDAVQEALNLVEFFKSRSISVVLPKDFSCINNLDPEKLEMFSADRLLDDWQPVDLGPKSLQEITLLLSNFKKILWIGPVKFGLSSKNADGALKLAAELHKQRNSEIIVIGKMAYTAHLGKCHDSTNNLITNASIVWEFLKGRNLPGLMALDRAYPFEIDWGTVYADPTQPLVVDVGSGNGLFLFRMARMRHDLNVLGLEMNEKLVNRCLDSISQSTMKNVHFIQANATTTFRPIVSNYPGKLVLVSIQCPNPDFNRPAHRWRMLQRPLVEAIADLLAYDGKVFLQSDIEAVAMRMKNEFIEYGKGKLVIVKEFEGSLFYQGEWLNENPFGVRSDWEQHVLDRGAPMYRLLLSKSKSIACGNSGG